MNEKEEKLKRIFDTNTIDREDKIVKSNLVVIDTIIKEIETFKKEYVVKSVVIGEPRLLILFGFGDLFLTEKALELKPHLDSMVMDGLLLKLCPTDIKDFTEKMQKEYLIGFNPYDIKISFDAYIRGVKKHHDKIMKKRNDKISEMKGAIETTKISEFDEIGK